MNLPNKITLSRILMVPVFMIFVIPYPEWFIQSTSVFNPMKVFNEFVLNYGKYFAAAIFIVASSTDGIDGYIARKKKLVTNLGKFLDPIADKLLIIAALIALVQRNEVTGWAALIIIARELLVTGLRLVAAGEGVVIAASRWGKLKTLSQIVAIVLILLDNFPLSLIAGIDFGKYAMTIAVILTIYSGYDYFRKNLAVLKSTSW